MDYPQVEFKCLDSAQDLEVVATGQSKIHPHTTVANINVVWERATMCKAFVPMCVTSMRCFIINPRLCISCSRKTVEICELSFRKLFIMD